MRGSAMRLRPCSPITLFILASFYVSSADAQEARNTPDTQQLLRSEGPGELATLRQKAEGGDPAAQTALGDRYVAGSGIPQDVIQTEHCYAAAAPQNFAEAQFVLRYLYHP